MAEPIEADTKRVRGWISWTMGKDSATATNVSMLAPLLAEVREETRELAEDNRDGDWCEAFGAVRGPVTQSRRREMVDEARRQGREEMQQAVVRICNARYDDHTRIADNNAGPAGVAIVMSARLRKREEAADIRDLVEALPLDGPEEGR